MNIKVLPYIDNTAGETASAATTPQASQDSASFDTVLDNAKKATAALAIDRLVAAGNAGTVDVAAVQRFFDQNGINIQLNTTAANTTGASSVTTASGASVASSAASAYSDSSVVTEASGLSCSAQLDAIFDEAAEKYGVDSKFLKSIAKCESDFSPTCTSSSGAMGIMQLMPATAASLGVTNAYDPYQNIMGGARYISEKLAQYNGDNSLALAAYNAGSGNVAKYGGIPPIKETQNYVKKVLAYYNS